MRSLARQLHAAPLLGQPRDAPVAVGEIVHEEEEQEHGELAHVHLAAGPPVVWKYIVQSIRSKTILVLTLVLTCHRGKSDLLELPPLLLQGLSIVPSVLRTVPVVQRVPLGGGLDGEGGVVAHHGVHLLVGFVVLQQHPVLLGGRGALLVIDGVRSRLPQVIPGGGAVNSNDMIILLQEGLMMDL